MHNLAWRNWMLFYICPKAWCPATFWGQTDHPSSIPGHIDFYSILGSLFCLQRRLRQSHAPLVPLQCPCLEAQATWVLPVEKCHWGQGPALACAWWYLCWLMQRRWIYQLMWGSTLAAWVQELTGWLACGYQALFGFGSVAQTQTCFLWRWTQQTRCQVSSPCWW